MNEQQLTQLETRVADLMAWKESITKERLTHPLDALSRKVLDLDRFAIITEGKEQINFHNLLETDLLSFGLTVYINGERRAILCMLPIKQFTANASTNTLTNINGQHNLKTNDLLALTTTNTLPLGLDDITIYYVVNPTATTFQLSLTPGGSAIDLLDTGTGQHYWGKEN